MKDNQKVAEISHAVGDRVVFHRAEGEPVAGKLVEDFAAYLLTESVLGRDWAPPRRWAVALDSGTLVFADDEDITNEDIVPTGNQADLDQHYNSRTVEKPGATEPADAEQSGTKAPAAQKPASSGKDTGKGK